MKTFQNFEKNIHHIWTLHLVGSNFLTSFFLMFKQFKNMSPFHQWLLVFKNLNPTIDFFTFVDC
jgi:hypothetical protein